LIDLMRLFDIPSTEIKRVMEKDSARARTFARKPIDLPLRSRTTKNTAHKK
jgi:hypothetical protein